ncbi:MAG: heme-binding domain-containing protein [Thermomicrobiales bacterium]
MADHKEGAIRMVEDAIVGEPVQERRRVDWLRLLRWTGIGIVVLLVAIQFIPYGRDHNNPPVTQPIVWDSPRTEELVQRACADCHSNETTWPWYSNIAPVSWLIQHDVDEGRHKLNFSEWEQQPRAAREAAETVQEGEMPPWYFAVLHPDAKLSDQEKQDLIDGFHATFSTGTRADDGQ